MRIDSILPVSICCLALATSCNQSSRPGPEAASASTPEAVATADTPQTQQPADTSAVPTAPAETPSGDVALPASSGKVWNNAQSDGNAPTGDRGLDDYRKVIQDNREKFRRCYDMSLKAHPGIKGNVTLKFVLTAKGEIKEAFVDKSASEITEADLETCMVAVLRTLSFPPSKRGMESTVRYPFNFNPHAPSASSR